MVAGNFPVVVRDAEEADLPALTAIRQPKALHRGRLRDAHDSNFRYLVLLRGEEIVGFVSLVFHRPPSWSNTSDTQHLPQIVDLYVAEAWRGQGYGSEAICALERIASEAGYTHLYIAVEPQHNPRAYALYQRLSYQPLQQEPYFQPWEAIDGDGKIRRGESWLVDMVKPWSG